MLDFKKIEDAFSDPESLEYANDYLKELRTNFRVLDNNLRRAIFLFLLFIALFELVTQATITEITVGPFKIANLAILQKLIPVFASYYYYVMHYSIAWRQELHSVHSKVVSIVYKKIFESGLYAYLILSANELLGSPGVYSDIDSTRLLEYLRIPILVTLMIGPVAFELYAFYQLFVSFGTADPIVWMALIVSVMFLLQAYIIFRAGAKIDREAI